MIHDHYGVNITDSVCSSAISTQHRLSRLYLSKWVAAVITGRVCRLKGRRGGNLNQVWVYEEMLVGWWRWRHCCWDEVGVVYMRVVAVSCVHVFPGFFFLNSSSTVCKVSCSSRNASCSRSSVMFDSQPSHCLVIFEIGGGLFNDITTTRSTQPCIPTRSLNRVPASSGVKAGEYPLPGGS